MIAIQSEFEAADFEKITISNSGDGVGFTASEIKPTSGTYKGQACVEAFVTVETANIRFRLDGTAPDTSTGHILYAGQNLTLKNAGDIANFLAIRDDSVDATIQVTYRF